MHMSDSLAQKASWYPRICWTTAFVCWTRTGLLERQFQWNLWDLLQAMRASRKHNAFPVFPT